MLNEFLKEPSQCGTDEKGGKKERVENMEAKNLLKRQNTNDDLIKSIFSRRN